MARLRVIVTSEDGSTLLYEEVVDTTLAGTAAEEAELPDVELALYMAAPEVCPWDCDSCRDV